MRFRNDVNNWTKNQLDDIVYFFKGIGISKDQLSTTGNPCILYGQLYTTYKDEIIHDVISKTELDPLKLFHSKSNDVIIPASGETPEDISTARCVLDDDVLLGGDLNVLRPKHHNGCFLSYQLCGKRKYDIAKIAQGKSIVHLHNEDLKKLDVYMPSNIKIEDKIVGILSLVDKLIQTQNKIIDGYKSLIKSIRNSVFARLQCDWKRLDLLIKDKEIVLKRGNIIPKHEQDNEYKYPVYSSSVQNNGLMGYSNYFMYDTELITWSIDGGGDIFYRKPHKFCVTNVCGIMELDKNKFNYIFVSEALKYQHSKMVFDYQTKAHPSVIEKLYSLPIISVDEQNNIAELFNALLSRLNIEENYLTKLKEQKKYLLSNMFI